jgi:hypothetical protein
LAGGLGELAERLERRRDRQAQRPERLASHAGARVGLARELANLGQRLATSPRTLVARAETLATPPRTRVIRSETLAIGPQTLAIRPGTRAIRPQTLAIGPGTRAIRPYLRATRARY